MWRLAGAPFLELIIAGVPFTVLSSTLCVELALRAYGAQQLSEAMCHSSANSYA